MAYTELIYKSPWCIEHTIYYAGHYGQKGEKRANREKVTPEQIRRQNQKAKENRVRRTIQLNFRPGDYWLTLKYPKGTRKPYEEAKKDFDRFIRTMKRRYKKQGEEMRYIYRIEIGKRGGIHMHLVLNRINDPVNDLAISDAWTRARKATAIEDMIRDELLPADGMAHLDHVRAVGNGAVLAEYITKEQPSVLEDGTEIDKETIKQVSKYGSSRNLVRPVPEKKTYSHWTVRKLIDMGAVALNESANRYRTEGYYIDKESWETGINPVTGLSYLQYTEIPGRRRRE